MCSCRVLCYTSLSESSCESGLSVRADAVPSAAPMAMLRAIHTGLDVAADRAAPTPAPIATPMPVLTPELLFATDTTVSPDAPEMVSTTIRRHAYVRVWATPKGFQGLGGGLGRYPIDDGVAMRHHV
jgi:hypothetical protein